MTKFEDIDPVTIDSAIDGLKKRSMPGVTKAAAKGQHPYTSLPTRYALDPMSFLN